MPSVQQPRGTRAALVALAGSGSLLPGQIYALTDEQRLALATSTATFETFAKESEAAGGGTPAPLALWDYWYQAQFASANATSTDMFAGAAVSAGTITTAPPVTNPPTMGFNPYGILIRSSTTANGGYAFRTTQQTLDFFGTISKKFRVQLASVTSFTGCTIRAGFLDTTTSADAVDGAYFEIVAGTAVAKTASNSTRTTSTSYAMALNVAYTLEIDVLANGTSARFRIWADQNETPVFDQTITTNIPTTVARSFCTGVVATEASTVASNICILYAMGVGTIAGFNRATGRS